MPSSHRRQATKRGNGCANKIAIDALPVITGTLTRSIAERAAPQDLPRLRGDVSASDL
jgi:hypothetical protein